MRHTGRLVSLGLVLALALGLRQAEAAGGAPLWEGGFEAGTLSPWHARPHDFSGAPPPEVVMDRVREGRFAVKFTVPEGARRTELVQPAGPLTHFTEGEDLYFGFSLYFDPSWPATPHWQIVTQWKQAGPGTPPLQLAAEGDRLTLRGKWYQQGHNHAIDLGPAGIPRGRWTDIVVRVRFSPRASVGLIEAWRDGVQVVGRTPWETMQAGRWHSYWKMGVYRDRRTPGATALWSDGWRLGRTYEEAAPRGTASD